MPANDRLTALDATFLELEQADDSALMHIGGALLLAPPAGATAPAIGTVREHLEQRLDLVLHPRTSSTCLAPVAFPGPRGSPISASRSTRTSVTRRSRRRATSASFWT